VPKVEDVFADHCTLSWEFSLTDGAEEILGICQLISFNQLNVELQQSHCSIVKKNDERNSKIFFLDYL
jgi:hypothetical protein